MGEDREQQGVHRLSEALSGRTLVLAVDRKAHELAASLERHGASIVHAPAMSTIPHIDDETLLERTRALITRPPQLAVVLTGVGLRGWMEAADAAGLGEDLRSALAGAEILARGPKAQGAVRQERMDTAWVAASETAAEIGEHLLGREVAGRRIAVQHHGSGADGLDEMLTAAGADVVSLTVYRWGPSRRPEELHRSVGLAGRGEADAVLFTSAPGATGWLEEAERAGQLARIRSRALAGELVMACVGPVTAAPLEERGLPVLLAQRMRMGSLARTVVQHFSAPAG